MKGNIAPPPGWDNRLSVQGVFFPFPPRAWDIWDPWVICPTARKRQKGEEVSSFKTFWLPNKETALCLSVQTEGSQDCGGCWTRWSWTRWEWDCLDLGLVDDKRILSGKRERSGCLNIWSNNGGCRSDTTCGRRATEKSSRENELKQWMEWRAVSIANADPLVSGADGCGCVAQRQWDLDDAAAAASDDDVALGCLEWDQTDRLLCRGWSEYNYLSVFLSPLSLSLSLSARWYAAMGSIVLIGLDDSRRSCTRKKMGLTKGWGW